MTSTADRAADYFAARLDYYTTNDVAHLDRAEAIADAAYDAGQEIDEIGLDNDARVAANGGKPLTTR